MNNNFLVIGSTGLLGQALVKELNKQDYKVLGIARKNADISIDITNEKALQEAIDAFKPDVIINAAAIVNLQYCEENPDICHRINAKPSVAITKHCALNNIKYVFISTDHYYTGNTDNKHSELSPLTLCNQYSISKQMGEEFSLANENALVVRTNIVGFRGQEQNPAFIEWVINTLQKNDKIQIFNDFYTSSIDVMSFSKMLIELIKQNTSGIINLASSQVSSKEKFIMALARRLKFSTENITVCSMKQIDHGIDRNESLGLDVSLAEKILKHPMPDLNEVIENIANEYFGKKSK